MHGYSVLLPSDSASVIFSVWKKGFVQGECELLTIVYCGEKKGIDYGGMELANHITSR
jgi:hypothetical protein